MRALPHRGIQCCRIQGDGNGQHRKGRDGDRRGRGRLPLFQKSSYPFQETGPGGVDFPDAFLDALPKPLHLFFDLFVAV